MVKAHFQSSLKFTPILIFFLLSIMNVYLGIAKGNSFLESFNNVYGIKWSEAKIVLSKILVNKTEPSIIFYDQFNSIVGGGGTQMKIFVAA